MSTYWAADIDEYVDVWFESLIRTMFYLKLTTTPLEEFNKNPKYTYDQLMRYK